MDAKLFYSEFIEISIGESDTLLPDFPVSRSFFPTIITKQIPRQFKYEFACQKR